MIETPSTTLQQRRLRLGLSQSDVGAILRVDPTAVSHVEAGRRERLTRLVTREDYVALLASLEALSQRVTVEQYEQALADIKGMRHRVTLADYERAIAERAAGNHRVKANGRRR